MIRIGVIRTTIILCWGVGELWLLSLIDMILVDYCLYYYYSIVLIFINSI